MAVNMKSTDTTVRAKRFYHRSSNFHCYPTQSKRVVQDGVSTVVDGQPIRFSGAAGDYGVYMTNDPAEIAYLEGRNDILTEEQYLNETTPVEKKLESAERELQIKNRLIEDLQRQQSRQGRGTAVA